MFRAALAALAAVVLVSASLIPDDAFARRGGGGGFRGGGGFHGGGARAGGFHRTAAATVVGRVRHIPSQVAQGVPDIQLLVVPVVQATQSRAEGIIGDTDTVRRR